MRMHELFIIGQPTATVCIYTLQASSSKLPMALTPRNEEMACLLFLQL